MRFALAKILIVKERGEWDEIFIRKCVYLWTLVNLHESLTHCNYKFMSALLEFKLSL